MPLPGAGEKPPIVVELQSPWHMGERPASRVANLMLLAMAVARRSAGAEVAVPVAGLACAAPPGNAFAMAVSRAFAHFDRAGLVVGWGEDPLQPVSSLPRRGRVHGPFWLAQGQLAQLRFHYEGRTLTARQQRALWSQCAGAAQGPAAEPRGDARRLEAGLETWVRLLVLRQAAEEGRLPLAEVVGAFEGVLDPAHSSDDDLSRLWALHLQARYARLARQTDVSRGLYARLLARCRASARRAQVPRQERVRIPVLQAMAEIGIAWCDHQDNRSAIALRRLQRMRAQFDGDAAASPPLRLSSRLAAEYFNLRALARRSVMLSDDGAPSRAEDAAQVLNDMQLALLCAVETDSLTLMEAVASNLGYTLWLLGPALDERLGRDAGRLLAIRWILAGEALCRRHGLGSGSYWNIIYICRVARGALSQTHDGSFGEGRQHEGDPVRFWRARVWPLADLRAQLQSPSPEAAGSALADRQLQSLCDLLLPPSLPDWLTLTGRMLAAVQQEGDAVSPVQLGAAMLEHLWQLALHGRGLAPLRQQLRALMPQLTGAQRRYVREELRRLSYLSCD